MMACAHDALTYTMHGNLKKRKRFSAKVRKSVPFRDEGGRRCVRRIGGALLSEARRRRRRSQNRGGSNFHVSEALSLS